MAKWSSRGVRRTRTAGKALSHQLVHGMESYIRDSVTGARLSPLTIGESRTAVRRSLGQRVPSVNRSMKAT